MSKVLFQEEQRFNQWWLWAILIFTAGVPLIVCLEFYLNGKIPAWPACIFFILMIGLIGLIYSMRLKTTITEEKITWQFRPLVTKELQWKEIKYARVFDYGFVGGWGVRIWTDYGTVYNMRGSKGLHLKTDKNEYVLGTQKEQELRSSIAHLLQ